MGHHVASEQPVQRLGRAGSRGGGEKCNGGDGWSGESVKMLNDLLQTAGFNVLDDGLKALWNPDEEALKQSFEFGKTLAGKL